MTWYPSQRAPALAAALGLGAVLAVALLMLGSSAAAAAMEFHQTPMRLNKYTDGVQAGLDLAVGPDDRVYAVWQDGRFVPSSGENVIYAAASPSDSRGRSFSDEARITPSDSTQDQLSPCVAVGPDGVVHVAWQQMTRPNGHAGTPPTHSIWYSRSRDGGLTWSFAIQVSQPNGVNNTRPSIAATPGDGAYVAWEMDYLSGTSVVLAHVSQGSREWVREDLARSSARWVLNGQVALQTERDGRLHAAWASTDIDFFRNVNNSQVYYAQLGAPDRTSFLPEPIPVADDSHLTLNYGPSLALTSRHGTWVAWAQVRQPQVADGKALVMADRIVGDTDDTDIVAGDFAYGAKPDLGLDACGGPGDAVYIAVAGAGYPVSPAQFTQVCSEYGCFATPATVVDKVSSASYNATIASDSLGNVHVGWDDHRDLYVTSRKNSPPGAPELLTPAGASHALAPGFEWGFNDPDAASSQSGFELQWAADRSFEPSSTSGTVLGAAGKAPRWQTPDAVAEGLWYWRVRTRDQLGLWSGWSGTGAFLLDRTPPSVTVAVNRGEAYTFLRTVVLTINASDNLVVEGSPMTFEVSNDPNFLNTSGSHEFLPSGVDFHWDLPGGEGIKVVLVRVVDSSGLSFTAVGSIIFNQTVLLIHTPILNAPQGEPLNVTCQVLRAPIAKAYLHFRVKGAKEYEKAPMTQNGTDYWFVVPKDSVTTKGIEYWVEVAAGSLVTTSPAVEPEKHPFVVSVYEPVNTFVPSVYSPILAVVGALLILAALLALWYFKLRVKPDKKE